MWDTLRRWRTWIFNSVMAVVMLPDVWLALAGYQWSMIIPPNVMPFVTLGVLLINVLMRPRAAVLPHEKR